MKKALLVATTAVTLAALSAPASACDPIPGALIFGGIGAAIGNAPGAAIGAIIGSAITGSAPCYYDRRYEARGYDHVYADRGYDRGYADQGYDRGYYQPEPAYQREEYVERQYAPAYRPAPVYYAPAPAYYAPPVVIYRSSYPKYYAPRYASYERPRYRDDRRYYDRRDWR